MPQQPESTSPLHLLQSCLLSNKEATQCLNDESPMQCFWNVLQSRLNSSSSENSVASLVPSSSAATSYSPTRAQMVNAHDDMRQDWNLSSFIWNNSDAASSFRG